MLRWLARGVAGAAIGLAGMAGVGRGEVVPENAVAQSELWFAQEARANDWGSGAMSVAAPSSLEIPPLTPPFEGGGVEAVQFMAPAMQTPRQASPFSTAPNRPALAAGA